MWVSTAPLRISLAGGGTDLPAYARRFGGAVVGVTIDLRTTVVGWPGGGPAAIHACLETCVDAGSPAELANPFAREVLRAYWDGSPVTVASFADAPAGTGLGSSAAFCVAMIAGLAGPGLPDVDLAEAAASVEIGALGRPVGKQDHYLCTLGGCQFLHFGTDGTVQVEPIAPHPDVVRRLDAELMLFSTGITRDAGTVLAAQERRIRARDAGTESRLHEIKELTTVVRDALGSGEVDQLGRALGRHWQIKQRLSSRVSLPAVDRAYRDAIEAGATGGKLLGAGGGGHLLLHAPAKAQAGVRAALAAHRLREQPFRLDRRGYEVRRVSTFEAEG
jgi:D-glycero-alpha-D-manno-heptose-7-phosphate kinase